MRHCIDSQIQRVLLFPLCYSGPMTRSRLRSPSLGMSRRCRYAPIAETVSPTDVSKRVFHTELLATVHANDANGSISNGRGERADQFPFFGERLQQLHDHLDLCLITNVCLFNEPASRRVGAP